MSKNTKADDIGAGVNISIAVVTAVILLRAILKHDADYGSGIATVMFVNSFLSTLFYILKD